VPVKSKPQSRIIFLTHESASSRLLAETLANTVGLAGIAVESRWDNRFKHHLRRFIGERLFAQLQSLITLVRHGNLERRIRMIEGRLKNQSIHDLQERLGRRNFSWPPGVSMFKTTHINSEANYKWCQNLNPDLLILFGVSILQKPMISLPKTGAINVHTALLPEYRGPWPEFWQAFNEDFDTAGVTIHVVTEQLDRGDIILQKPSHPSHGMNPYQIRALNMMTANQILPIAAQAFLNKEISPMPQQDPKIPIHRLVDITRDKRLELIMKLGLRV
jgi:hypothetical protein